VNAEVVLIAKAIVYLFVYSFAGFCKKTHAKCVDVIQLG